MKPINLPAVQVPCYDLGLPRSSKFCSLAAHRLEKNVFIMLARQFFDFDRIRVRESRYPSRIISHAAPLLRLMRVEEDEIHQSRYTPTQRSFSIAPGSVTVYVKVSDRENDGCIGARGALFRPRLCPAIVRASKELKWILARNRASTVRSSASQR